MQVQKADIREILNQPQSNICFRPEADIKR